MAATSDGEIIIVYDDNFVGLTCDNTSWLVNSGASSNVISRANFFISYTSGEINYVRIGNEGISKIVEKGNVCLKTGLGCTLVLKDVRHDPDIHLNLISTSKLDDEGYINQFDGGKQKLTKGSLIVAREEREFSLHHTCKHTQDGGERYREDLHRAITQSIRPYEWER